MKRFLVATVLALAAVTAIGALAYAAGTTGNGAPSGAHYNLNIIGVAKDKPVDFSGGNGHRIFVDLGSNSEVKGTKIMLTEDDYFGVLDANGTDGVAAFQLPNPDPTNSGTSEYSVFARELGKTGGKANMSTCADYTYVNDLGQTVTETLCSVSVLPLERVVGKNGDNKFINATQYLFYIYLDLDGNGTAERYNLFSDALQDYFWQYDNLGLKVLQLRFYPGVPTTVPDTVPVP